MRMMDPVKRLSPFYKNKTMHRFIVYQYGKVGSTAVVNTLEKMQSVEAFQVHFFGPEAFRSILNRLTDPDLSDYFFEHSSGQLMHNLRVYRHFLRAEKNDEAVTILSMFREPFDWFRSCITQEIEEHLGTFRLSLDKQGIDYESDEEAIVKGCEHLFSRILRAIEVSGGIDSLKVPVRHQLDKSMDFTDKQDFDQFLFLLSRFLTPHVWFKAQFLKTLDTPLEDLRPLSDNLYRAEKDWGNIYLMRYENLKTAFDQTLRDLGYENPPALVYSNVSAHKPFHEAVNRAFRLPVARELDDASKSEFRTFFGYDDRGRETSGEPASR